MGGCQSPGRSATSSARIASPPVRTEVGRKAVPTPAPRIAGTPEHETVPAVEPGQFSIPQEPAQLQPVREDIVPLPDDLEEPPAQQAANEQGFVAQISHEVVQGRQLQPIGSHIFGSYRTNVSPRTYRPTMNSKPQRVAVPAYTRPVVHRSKSIDESHRNIVTLGAPEFIVEMKPVGQPIQTPRQLPIKEVSQTKVIPQTLPISNDNSLPGWSEVMQPNGKLPASFRPTGIQSQSQMPKVTPASRHETPNSWESWSNHILKRSK